MSNLDSLVRMKKSVIFGKTPPGFLQEHIQVQAVVDTGKARALRHARAFVEALENTRGAPRGNVWSKQEHREPRVYFAGTLGFVRVSPQGVISGDNSREARLTLYMPGLYPSQRSAYRKAKELYEAGAKQREAENVAALQERMAEINEELDRHPRVRPFLEADDEGADEAAEEDGDDEDFDDEDFDDEDFDEGEDDEDDEDDEDEVVTLDELRERVRLRDEENDAIERAAERAAWQERHEAGRRNPLPLPEGFTTRFGGGVSDDYVPPTISEARRVLRGAQRGDVVTVGRTQWVIKRPVGDVQAYAYKHPSKRTKTYEILLAGTDDDDEDEVVVFEVGGSGQQISEVLTTGPLRRTGTTVDL
jgi:hypothetical protein